MVSMLKSTKLFHHAKTLVVSVIAISLGACSPATETTTTSTDSVTAPTSVATSSPLTTSSPTTVAIPGVNNVREINFKPASPNSTIGFFDAVNGSSATKVEVSKETPIVARGWAILPTAGRPPDSVIITSGDSNSVVAVAPVNLARPDVARILKNPAYSNSGWNVTFNPSTLPTDQVRLKAWAYNSTKKEALELKNTHEVVVLK